MVDESAVTGESAPVSRESGGDRSGVTAGMTVLSDAIVVRVTSRPGHSFIDRMIALVEGATRQKTPNEIAVLFALLVTLIPTTIGALLPAIGIAGMDRLVQRNVIAIRGRAVEAAGDMNTLRFDKTGTITPGNRDAAAFIPLPGVTTSSRRTPPNCPRSPTKRPRADPSSPSTASAARSCPSSASNSSTCWCPPSPASAALPRVSCYPLRHRWHCVR
ncbi:hypothetical protein ADK59_20645 [Streptomyces sp. XY332]|nr:hypothetical protein ADK59_20645 [Streptomyces sp. XY332]